MKATIDKEYQITFVHLIRLLTKSFQMLGFTLIFSICDIVLGRKLMILNEMLGNQTETQLWALEMTPIGFRCDNKPIQARRNKDCT